MNQLNQESFLRIKHVKVLTGLSKTSIYKAISNGSFPSPIKIGHRSVAWISSEINSWIKSRIQENR